MYEAQVSQLDRELQELCTVFHEAPSKLSTAYWLGLRDANLRKLAQNKQASVTRILTQMLNDKKQQLPYLATDLKSIPRDKALRVAVRDQTARGLLLAGRLANKPFKQAVRQLAAELSIPSNRVIFGPPKSLAGITRKLAAGEQERKLESNNDKAKKQNSSLDIFDLNRVTICFEDEDELRAILAALPRHFGEDIVVLKNKFQEQWEEATQPPCVHLNLKLKVVPPGLRALLATTGASGGSEWVVELQLTLRDFLEVKKRCHAIYEILRSPPTAALPRACPVCGMLQTFISLSQLQIESKGFGGAQKFVRKAKWEGKEVAYSMLGSGEETCSEVRATFLREVGLLTRLEHPNIVQILGVVHEEEELGFVTEWVSKDTLWDLLRITSRQETDSKQVTTGNNTSTIANNSNRMRQRRLGSISDVWDVALQLCDALIYVHDQGVVHFDLKSKNVLCVNLGSPRSPQSQSQKAQARSQSHYGRWRVKLCDFGLSRELNSSVASAKAVGGTLHWQAPETFGLIRSFLPAADVYSFGGVLIELFGQDDESSRCWPWMKKLENEVRERVLKGEKPPELYTISQALVRELVEDCLSFEADSRPSMREVRARLLAAQLECEEESCINKLNPVLGNHVRQVLVILREGQKSFSECLPKYRDSTTAEMWTQTLHFLDRHSSWSPRFEVALAMCHHFVPESSSLSRSLSLLVVSEKHLQEVVGARYLSGWCLMNDVGGARDESRAVLHYSQASLEGYTLAQYELALCFRHGRGGVAQDHKEAARLFQQAAEQGHVGAQLCIARCFGVGEGVPAVDLQTAMTWLCCASMGMKSQLNVATVNHDGDVSNKHIPNLKLNLDKVIDAEKNKGESQSYLCAACFEQGKASVEQDMEEAHRLYKLYIASVMPASPQRVLDPEDQFKLGECYYHGRGIEEDKKEAARLFQLSADRGHAEGIRKLGLCHELGQGVNKDVNEAVRLYRLSANQGDSTAQNNLGLCYELGKGVDKDMIETVRLYRLSANQGNPNGQNNLGVRYELGEGVDKDMSEAVRLYRLSATQGNSIGQNNLGLCYEHGKGVNKDINEAVRLYRLSANQGNSNGQINLGLCYEYGKGVDKDMIETVRLYRLSANHENPLGQNYLGVCYELGKGVDKDMSEAARLYRLSAIQGNSIGQNNLGLCYELGKGVDKDINEAVRLYRLSANQGNSIGQSNLYRLEKT